MNKIERMAKKAERLAKKLGAAPSAAAQRRRLREWVDFLRDDADWDFDYILSVLAYKLKRTRERIAGKRIIKDWRKVAGEIGKVEALLKRVLDDEYHEEVFRDYYRKYGHPKMKWTDLDPEECKKSGARPGQLVGMEVLYKGKPSTPEMDKEFLGLSDKEFEAKKADLRKAFDLMAENIWGWWE